MVVSSVGRGSGKDMLRGWQNESPGGAEKTRQILLLAITILIKFLLLLLVRHLFLVASCYY